MKRIPLACVSESNDSFVFSAPPENILASDGRLKGRPRPVKKPEHIRFKEIRVLLDLTQVEYASLLKIPVATIISYEQAQTMSVPAKVTAKAEALYEKDKDGILQWRARFDHLSMVDILNEWGARLHTDSSDLASMAHLTGIAISTISRWRNGKCRPSISELIAYDKTVNESVLRLESSGFLNPDNKVKND